MKQDYEKNDNDILQYIIAFIVSSIILIGTLNWKYFQQNLSLDLDYIEFNNYIMAINDFLNLSKICFGIFNFIISIVIFPLIDKRINQILCKNFSNEKIYLKFYNKRGFIIAFLGLYFALGDLLGKIIIPFVLFTDNINNLNLYFCVILYISVFFAILIIQYAKFIITSKRILILTYLGVYNQIPFKDIIDIKRVFWGIKIIYKNELGDERSYVMLKQKSIIDKIIQVINEQVGQAMPDKIQ